MDIFQAVWKGKLDVVRRLVESDPHIVHAALEDGSQPLHAAASKGRPEIVELLLNHGADPNARMTDGSQPLHCVGSLGKKLEVMKLLVDAGAALNLPGRDGFTPLQVAICHTDKLAEFLLDAGANPNARGKGGGTALHVACDLRKYGLAARLLEKGADLKLRDDSGRTALHLCAFNNGKKGVLLLLDHGEPRDLAAELCLDGCAVVAATLQADKKQLKDFSAKADLLYRVVEIAGEDADADVMELLRLLLELGVDPNARYWGGRVPLEGAIFNKNVAVAKLLLENGADVNATNRFGEKAGNAVKGSMKQPKEMIGLIKKYTPK